MKGISIIQKKLRTKDSDKILLQLKVFINIKHCLLDHSTFYVPKPHSVFSFGPTNQTKSLGLSFIILWVECLNNIRFTLLCSRSNQDCNLRKRLKKRLIGRDLHIQNVPNQQRRKIRELRENRIYYSTNVLKFRSTSPEGLHTETQCGQIQTYKLDDCEGELIKYTF